MSVFMKSLVLVRVKKILQVLIAVFVIISLIISISLQYTAEALLPGLNTLVNYNSTNSAVSASSGNTKAHISEDGKTVVWLSSSRDIVSGDTSIGQQLYMRNLQSGVTSIVSADYNGAAAGAQDTFAISRTARYIAFTSTNLNVVSTHTLTALNRNHLYLRDTVLGTTTMVDQSSLGVPANLPDGGMSSPVSVSDDGRFIVFNSQATNLLSSNNPTTMGTYAYVKDRHTGQVINPTTSSAGVRANAVAGASSTSCDGSLIVFGSNATNLTPQDNGRVNTYLVDLRNGYAITNLTSSANQSTSVISMSCNGRYILVSSKATNLTADQVSGTNAHYFRYDRLLGTYELIDKSTTGYIPSTQQPSSYGATRLVSDDGKVVFFSSDRNLVTPMASSTYLEIYLRDPEAGTTSIVPVNASGVEKGLANGTTEVTQTLEITASGNGVLYLSFATDLVPGVGSGADKKLILSKIE